MSDEQEATVVTSVNANDSARGRAVVVQLLKIEKRYNQWQYLCSDEQGEQDWYKYSQYLSLYVGDVIAGKVDNNNNFIDRPQVRCFNSKDGFFNFVTKLFKGKSYIAINIYRFLERYATTNIGNSSPIDAMNQLAEKADETTYLLISSESGVEFQDVQKLCKVWVKDYLIRRLILLGCTRQEVYDAANYWLSHSDMYQQLMTDPLAVYHVNWTTCINLMSSLNIRYTYDQREAAKLLRTINDDLKNKGWTCKPLQHKSNELTDDDIELLTTRFNCQLRNKCLYLPHMWKAEDICLSVLTNSSVPEDLNPTMYDMKLNDEQKLAIQTALKNRFSCIIGGPGTGKSTIIARLSSDFGVRNINALATAFTGKAVSRLRSIHKDNPYTPVISTIHSSLTNNDRFGVIIIDEMSMVSLQLLARCLSHHYHKDLRIIFVGDVNQLCSIEQGEVLNELIKFLPTVTLNIDCRRQSRDGVLFNNLGVMINNSNTGGDDFSNFCFAEGPIAFPVAKNGQDMYHIPGTQNEVLALVNQLKQNFDLKDTDLTVICPYREPCDNLNKELRKIWLGDDMMLVKDSFKNEWSIGDRIIMTENRNDINVMNGEEGRILGILNNELLCSFEGKDVSIPMSITKKAFGGEGEESGSNPLSSKLIQLAHCITTHRSQGSEWMLVVFYIPPNKKAGGFLSRRLCFTALSRAKNLCFCVCDDKDVLAGSIIMNTPKRIDNLALSYKEALSNAEMRASFATTSISS